MAPSTDITLPRDHVAVFPRRCVACLTPEVDSSIKVTDSVGLWRTLLFFGLGPRVEVVAPACRACARKLRLRLWLSVAVTLVIAAAVIWGLWPLVGSSVPAGLRRLTQLGLVLLCLVPQAAFEVFFPPAFEITAGSESVDYEFASTEYAVEFAALNTTAAWMKIDGETFVPPSQAKRP